MEKTTTRPSISDTPISADALEAKYLTDGKTPVNAIDSNPYQLRVHIDQKEIETLKKSIEKIGLLTRLLVRPHPTLKGRFQLVNGQRRLLAVKALGWVEVPVDIRVMSDSEVAQATIAENMQREDLNAIDEAQGYKLMISEFGSTEREVANLAGKSRSYVANRLRLLQMERYLILCVLAKTLAPWQALMIQASPINEKYRLADLVIDWDLTFEELRDAITAIRSGGDTIRFKRSVPVKGLVINPKYYDVDTTLFEKYLAEGTQLFPVSVWVDGVVRLGEAMVVAARCLGVETLAAEVVFETAWLSKEATLPVESCSIDQIPDKGIFPPRTSTQRESSRKLRELLVGQEEKYPILIIAPPIYETDTDDAAEDVPNDDSFRSYIIGKNHSVDLIPEDFPVEDEQPSEFESIMQHFIDGEFEFD